MSMDTNHASILYKKPLKLCTFNVNSIRSAVKQTLVTDFIERKSPHVLMLTESKLDSTYNPRFANYQQIAQKDRNAGGGRVLCLVKNGLKYHGVKEFDLGPNVQICRFLIKTTQVVAVYKSPTTNSKDKKRLINQEISVEGKRHADRG